MNDRKRQVILASLKLFADKGFHNTSIQDIIAESHISKGTFYNYFTSKKDCLIAILDIGSSDATLRKAQFLIGKRLDDKSVLASQISTIMQVNRERNLLPIFESIMHSGDKELKKLVKDYHLKEMDWLSKRLLDVYGGEIAPYRYDATLLLFGMMHQLLLVSNLTRGPETDAAEIARYAIKQLDVIVPSLIKNHDTFLGIDLHDYILKNSEQKELSSEKMLEQLKGFKDGLEATVSKKCVEYTDCLIEEFSSEKPRYYIISTIAYQFYSSFQDSKHALEALELTNEIWKITHKQKQEDSTN